MDMQETPKTEEDTTPAGAAAAEEEQEINQEPGIDVEDIDDFGAVLAEYEANSSVIKEGEVVHGRVIRLMEKDVVVDIGYKSEGIIDKSEFRGTDGKIHVAEGDEVDVLLEKTEDSNGYVVLSKEKAERLKVWKSVEDAYEKNERNDGDCHGHMPHDPLSQLIDHTRRSREYRLVRQVARHIVCQRRSTLVAPGALFLQGFHCDGFQIPTK